MLIQEFEDLTKLCKITHDTEADIVNFEVKDPKDEEYIKKILNDNKLINPKLSQLQELFEKLSILIQARKKIEEKKISEFEKMTTNDVAKLSLEKKLEYLELLFPDDQLCGDLMKVCEKNEQNIKACLFNMDYPKSFWDSEKKLADRFVSLIEKSPDIKNTINNWENVKIDEKKALIYKSADVFNYVYGTHLEIGFYTPEEYKEDNKKYNLNENAHVPGAYAKNDKIFFNLDRLSSSDNFYAISVPFHEGHHIRQENKQFEESIMNRVFANNVWTVSLYEDEVQKKDDKNYKDMYLMLPGEVHSYRMQFYIEEQLTEKLGIEKTKNDLPQEELKSVQKIWEKANIMTKISEYKQK